MAQPRLLVSFVGMIVVAAFTTILILYRSSRVDVYRSDVERDTSKAEACISNRSIPWKVKLNSSEYFASKLSHYKARHRRCALEARRFGKGQGSHDCKFMVWIAFEGLGNRMLSITSSFVYALLTDRVLLVDRGTDMPQLFCEPFPSWFLPVDFPYNLWMDKLGSDSYESLHILNRNRCSTVMKSLPEVVYMHLDWFSTMEEKSFFCEYEQQLVQEHVKWLFIRANAYYVPALHSIPVFSNELHEMFPETTSIFTTTARLVLQPTESVRRGSLDYFKEHLAGADQIIGIQMRPFSTISSIVAVYEEQLWSCLLSNNIINSIVDNDAKSNATSNILVTSLDGTFADALRNKLSLLKVPGVKVHTPSIMELQKTGDVEHDKQALEEILLLSMSDILVTSPRSTFGYVPQGLSGLRSLTLRGIEQTEMRQLTCGMSESPDPGFLFNPPLQDCNCRNISEHSKIVGPCVDDPARCLQIYT